MTVVSLFVGFYQVSKNRIALFLKKLSYPLIFVYAKQTLIKYHPISMSYGMVFGIIF